MSHSEQRAFCEWVRDQFPDKFTGLVLDCGSLDINGNNRYLFDKGCQYFGLDICEGPNVDLIGRVHEYEQDRQANRIFSDYVEPLKFDTIISTEMLEHDEYYQASLRAMARMLKPGGLLLFTCATTGRPEHGTARTTPTDSPVTLDYYRNLESGDIAAIPGFLEHFDKYQFFVEDNHKDLCFYGWKKLSC